MDSAAFYDALNCASLSVLHAEGGDRYKAALALLEASAAAASAFPAGSGEARALGVILDAAARVQELTA